VIDFTLDFNFELVCGSEAVKSNWLIKFLIDMASPPYNRGWKNNQSN
jgi:hypothetical protein